MYVASRRFSWIHERTNQGTGCINHKNASELYLCAFRVVEAGLMGCLPRGATDDSNFSFLAAINFNFSISSSSQFKVLVFKCVWSVFRDTEYAKTSSTRQPGSRYMYATVLPSSADSCWVLSRTTLGSAALTSRQGGRFWATSPNTCHERAKKNGNGLQFCESNRVNVS